MPSNHLILCHPLLLLFSIFPSIRAFSNESALHIRWPKYWSFSFNISPSNEHPGRISFSLDRLDLLAVKGLSRFFSNTTGQKHQFFGSQLYSPTLTSIHDYWKNHSFDYVVRHETEKEVEKAGEEGRLNMPFCDVTLSTKICLVKAMVFLVVMYGCDSWTINKAECQRMDAFEMWW